MSAHLPDQSPTKTKTIGQYEIGSTIGKGTFASVRQAKHIPTQQQVAIKILAKNMIVDTRDKLNISREIRILRKVRHPNIAQLLQIMQTTKNIYLIMQWIPGGELFHEIINSQKNRLDQAYACKLFLQLLNSVEYLHDIGVTHRDIKPENILLDEYKNAKLIDFGLSNFYQTGQTLHTACGSPCYAAPEMLSQNKYDPKVADLWSCGIVLYAMVCGFLPFQDQNTKVLYEKVTKGQYDQPSFLSEQAKNIFKKMLALRPQERLSIQQIRKHPFVTKHGKFYSSNQQKTNINGGRKSSTSKTVKKIDQLNNFIKTRGLFPGQIIPIQEDIIEKMRDMGMAGCRKDIEKHINSKNTATYYLLLYQKLRNKQESLNAYYQKINKGIKNSNKPVRSYSLVLKKNVSTPHNSIDAIRSKMLPTINHESRQNQQQIEFLEKISKKNKQKIRSLVTGIRIRKVIS